MAEMAAGTLQIMFVVFSRALFPGAYSRLWQALGSVHARRRETKDSPHHEA